MAPRSLVLGTLVFLLVAAVAPTLPAWLVSLATIAFANALVVLGLVILWRAGLVPFGQALFYAVGAYAVALIARYSGLRDVLLLIAAAAALSWLTAFLAGFLLARYREIFFAMLSLAMSMILYGVLVKTETLGSTDGFSVEPPTYLGYAPQGRDALADRCSGWCWRSAPSRRLLVVAVFPLRRRRARGAGARQRDSPGVPRRLGRPAYSPQPRHRRHARPASAARLAALSIEHVDPNMAYWTTSGGFVFVTILAGAGSVAAAFVGSFVFELLKSIALRHPAGHLADDFSARRCCFTILFLPEGIGSLFVRLRHRRKRGADETAP